MSEGKVTAITPQDAFDKYFGKVTELDKKPHPFPCTCGKFSLMSLSQDWIGHIRFHHKERIMSPKQIEMFNKRRAIKEAKQAEKQKRHNIFT